MIFSKCYRDPTIITNDFPSDKEYNKIWDCIVAFGKGKPQIKQAWEQYQNIFNTIMTESFISFCDKTKLQICCCNDDKLNLHIPHEEKYHPTKSLDCHGSIMWIWIRKASIYMFFHWWAVESHSRFNTKSLVILCWILSSIYVLDASTLVVTNN